jgi:hypothetical protein
MEIQAQICKYIKTIRQENIQTHELIVVQTDRYIFMQMDTQTNKLDGERERRRETKLQLLKKGDIQTDR